MAGTVEPESGPVRRGRDVRIAVLDQDPRCAADRRGTRSWPAGRRRHGRPRRCSTGSAWASCSTRRWTSCPAARPSGWPWPGRWSPTSDLLILDEPTNHLDIDAIAWLEDRLAAYRGGLVLVTHDRHLLDRVTTRVLELDRGAGYVHEGGYDAYLEGRAEREEQAATAEDRRRNLARTELAWLRRGAPARTSQAQGPHRVGHRHRRGAGPGRGPRR